jgi:hypothetical protein
MTVINLGNLKFTWKGTWAATTAYNRDDIVRYGANAYVCVSAHTSSSTFAANSIKFELMAQGITFDGNYNPATLYQVNDIVSYGGAIYVSIQEGTGQTPSGNPSYWSKLVGGVEFENNYSGATQYQTGDIVKYGGYTYIASQDTLNNLPTNVTYWAILNKGYTNAGTYSPSIDYKPGELVRYSGRVYACEVYSVAGTLPTVTANWFLFADGQKWLGTWDSLVNYNLGDIVQYGAYTYICIQAAVGNNTRPTRTLYWAILSKGFDWKGQWSTSSNYKPGDVVSYGPRTYVCTNEIFADGSTINPPEIETYDWDLLNDGFSWQDVWSASSEDYKIGDVVRYGARSYVCIVSHISSGAILPTNATYWNLVNKGLDWKGAWSSSSVVYKLDDVVEYSGSSYVCVTAHTSSASPTPNVDSTNWFTLAQGDISSPMTTTGDMIYRNSAGATVRLPIGGAGAYLVVNNGVPSWGIEAPERNYYVSTTGSDTNDGRTIATAWRTIQYAATQTFNNGLTKINCMAGTYNELTPIKLGRSVVLEGDGLGAVVVSPDSSTDKGYGVGISKDGSTPNANSNVFHVNNGSRVRNIVFRGFSNGAVCVSLDPGYGPNDTSVWIVSQSPYVQNCTSFTDGGTGMIVDGALHNGGYRSIVANDWTQINSDGFGMIVKNDGRSELVSCFTYYCTIGYLCESGGKIRSVAGNNSYGTFGAVARGFSQLETPLRGLLQLQDDTVNSITTLSANMHVFTSYKDTKGNTYYVGHTNPTASNISSSWSNSSSNPIIAKYDSAGALDWMYTYEDAYGAIHSVVEMDDQLYAGGVIYNASTNKGFLLKVNLAGEIAWQKIVGDTSEIVDVTSDGGNYIYAVGNHNTYGSTVIKIQPAGIISWSKALDYNDSSTNTLNATSICYAGTPTTSTDTYAAEGDASIEDDLFISCRDATNSAGMIVRMTSAGTLVTAYNYGNIYINKLRLDTGNGDGIYMAAVGYYDPTGAVTKTPFIMRVTMLGAVAWQQELVFTTSNGEFKDVIPLGDDIYVSGYVNDTSNTYNRGMIARYRSTGVRDWIFQVTNGTDDVAFTGVTLDGVNIIAAGIIETSGVVVNIQKDRASGLGTVTSGSWALTTLQSDISAEPNNIITKANQQVYLQSPTIALSDTALVLNQSSGKVRNIIATRAGFAGIGTGVNFTVSGLTREPKQGSVVQIYNDQETYFLIGTSNYIAPTIVSGNNPFAKALLSANKTFLQDEVIAYINFTYPSFVYNQTLCRRDVGYIIDALLHDLDYATNGESVDAGISYYNSTSSLIAITTQKTETLAAIARLKSTALDVIQKNAVSRSTGNVTVQYIAGTTGEAGAVTLLGSNLDTITTIINAGAAVAPDKIGYGVIEVGLNPAIPSNKTPTDGSSIIFREAYSQVRMTGHDFLDIGTGGFASTNYPVIIASDYTQAPDQNQETLSETGGRVFYVTTDQDGNFRVGDYFKVEQATGRSTINAQEFNLSGLNELQLGSITAGRQGATVNEFSTDGTFGDNSDTSVPTERAVKTYVDNEISIAIGAANRLKVGTAPNESEVEITGTGASTDTIDFSINGSLRARIGNQYLQLPTGATGDRPGTASNGFIRYNTTNSAFEGYVGGQWSGIGGGNPWVIKTGAYTAANNDRLFVNTTSAAVTITLPATPNIGDTVRVIDAAGTFATNNCTIGRNGSKIMGDTADMTIDTQNAAFTLVYCDATNGWRLGEA